VVRSTAELADRAGGSELDRIDEAVRPVHPDDVAATGSGSGFQRIWSGETGPSPKRSWKRGCANGSKRPCIAAGRIRYSQLRRFSLRGAVNAVPDNCSA
jgi:hypothetical protein